MATANAKGRQMVIKIKALGVSLSLDEIDRGLDVEPDAFTGFDPHT